MHNTHLSIGGFKPEDVSCGAMRLQMELFEVNLFYAAEM